jgi:2-oxoglutarate ferredoxin oxidoreductase subunit gamma
VAMNYPSLEKFESAVAEKGLIFLNTSLINETPARSDVEVIRVPTLDLAREAGSDRAVNMVMIGAVCAKSGLLAIEDVIQGMEAALKGKEKFFPLNRKGIERGFAFIAENQ